MTQCDRPHVVHHSNLGPAVTVVVFEFRSKPFEYERKHSMIEEIGKCTHRRLGFYSYMSKGTYRKRRSGHLS